jgi:hypothetical protein
MPRSRSVHRVISLPDVGLSSAITLGRELVTAAQTELSPRIASVVRRMRAAYGALHEAARHASAPLGRRETDRRLDGAWATLFGWLSGWSKRPSEPAAAERARRIRNALYPARLKLPLPVLQQEWSETGPHAGNEEFGSLAPLARVLGART